MTRRTPEPPPTPHHFKLIRGGAQVGDSVPADDGRPFAASASDEDEVAPWPRRRRHPPSPPPPQGLEWFDDVEPVLSGAYLIKGLLDAGTMSVVYGPSNSGKTFLALDLAYHVATGAAWRGHRVSQGSVLYLAAEGGAGVANRIAGLRLTRGGAGVPLALRRAGLDLLHEEADLQTVVSLAAEVQARRPTLPLLIVVDTLSRVMAGGDENSPIDMTSLIRNIDAIRRATGAHVMLVHHTGKDVARGARGHSSLRAATDTEIEIQAVGDGGREAVVTKQRDHGGGRSYAFVLRSVALGQDQDGDDVSTCVVAEADAKTVDFAKRAKRRGRNQTIIMETWDQMRGEGLARPNPPGVGMPEAGRYWVVDVGELRRIAMGKMPPEHAAKVYRQAMTSLTGPEGLMVVGDNLVWRLDRPCK